jgi:VWFA-related protein
VDVGQGAVVALVFDQLGPETGRAAVGAARKWVASPSMAGRQVAVFRIDQGLDVLQDFTDDGVTLRDALDGVLADQPASSRFEYDRERVRVLRDQLVQPEASSTTPGPPAPFRSFDPTAGPGERAVESRQGAMELAMLEATEALERDQQGLATTNALLALVNGLGALPGRKAVVYFSYGLMLPGRDLDALRTIVSEANRKGVSFYAADGAGRKEAMLRRAAAPGLGKLARDTGGALISGTGEFSAGLRRVEEDLGTHYVLAYTPASEAWDGGYRRVEIEVHRDGLVVQGRRGYFAVRTPAPTPILEHEAPVLAALQQAPGAAEIPLRVSALQFPDAGGDTTVAIVADLPVGGPTLRAAEGDEGTWTQDFTVLALVRNEEARIVHKSSRRYVLSWGEESLDEVEVRRVLFEREALLPPGRYTIEVRVRDAQSGRMGADRAPLVLQPVDDDELRVSSLMVVGYAEPRPGGDPSPLLHEGVRYYPNLGDPVSREKGQPLAFLFTLRPGARALAAATVELLRGDRSVLQSSIALPAPDPSGQMRVVSGLQLKELESGAYVLRLHVNNAHGFQTRSTAFTLGR